MGSVNFLKHSEYEVLMARAVILAIDQGTTGTTALLFDDALRVLGKVTAEFAQHYPKPGWVEHDLNEIWRTVLSTVTQALEVSGIKPNEVTAIGITNQRETTCLWETDAQGTPLHRAIVWQDRRTTERCSSLRKRGLESGIRKKTGLWADPYFSATKLEWLLKNVSGASKKLKQGILKAGTIDSYLLYRMTAEHATDPSNASRTMLMNLKTCQWDDELLRLFKIPKAILPTILPSAVEYGKTRSFAGLPDGIPVTGISGDQQAALFGQACFQPGGLKCTYGTGAFILVNIGSKPVLSKHKLLTTVAWKLGNQVTYGIEGSSFIAGAAVQWLRDQMGFLANAAEVESLARSVNDSGGVTFVPALTGLGAPHWIAEATGTITGLTRGSGRGHLARAVLEGVAFQVAELVSAMAQDLGKPIREIRVDGGASANDLLMQMQSDFTGARIVRSEILETTALGAGLQAGLGAGIFSDLSAIQKAWNSSETFSPKMTATMRKKELNRWDRAVRATKAAVGR